MSALSPTNPACCSQGLATLISYRPLNASPLSLLCTHVCSFLILHCSLLLFLPVRLLLILQELFKYHFLYKSFQNPPTPNSMLFFHRLLFIFLVQYSTNLHHSNTTLRFLPYFSTTMYGLVSVNPFMLQLPKYEISMS